MAIPYLYLDTSDYSDLSRPTQLLSESNKTVLKRLRDRVEDHGLVCPLSILHILEATHSSLDYRDAAIRRAALQRDLAAGIHLCPPMEVAQKELDRFLEKSCPVSLGALLSKESHLFGFHVSMSWADNRERFRGKLVEGVENSALPRRQRLRLLATLKSDKPSASEPWWELWERNARPEAFEFPLNLLPPTMLLRWFFGEISDDQLSKRLRAIISDPPTLIGSLLDANRSRDQFYRALRDIGESISINFMSGLQKLTKPVNELLRLGLPPERIRSEIREVAEETLTTSTVCAVLDPRLKQLREVDLRAFLRSAPSSRTFATLVKAYAYRLCEADLTRILEGREPEGSKPSDYADLLHAIYAPYMTAFRCDRSFAALVTASTPKAGPIIGKRLGVLDFLNRPTLP